MTNLKPLSRAMKHADAHLEPLSPEERNNRKEKVLKEVRKLMERD